MSENLFDVGSVRKVLQEVESERFKQESKWGIQNHCPKIWLMILGEEVGEANKAVLDAGSYAMGKFTLPPNQMLYEYRKELVQVAAVAVAMIECLDRNQ